MSSEEIKAVRFICRGCGKRIIVEQGEKPDGYHGFMELLTTSGEQGGDVYACRRACIQKAVLAAVGETGPSEEKVEETRRKVEAELRADADVNPAGLNIPGNGPAV